MSLLGGLGAIAGLAGQIAGAKKARDPRAYGKGKKGNQLRMAGGVIGGLPIAGASAVLPAGTVSTVQPMIQSSFIPALTTPSMPGVGGVVESFITGMASSFDPRPTTSAGGTIDALTPDFLVRPMGYRKRRRMNPLNVRAARRAIRRIKAVRKITADIERSLPKAKARRPASWKK